MVRKLIQHNLFKSCCYKLIYLAALVIVLIAIFISLVRAFTPYVTQHKAQVNQWVSKALKQPVDIGSVTTAWRGLEPVLQLHDITLLSNVTKQPEVRVKNLEVGINLWESFLKFHIEPGIVVIAGAHLSIVQVAKNQFILKGVNIVKPITLDFSKSGKSHFIKHLLGIDHLLLSHINISWYNNKQQLLTKADFTLNLKNGIDSHRIWGWLILKNKLKNLRRTKIHYIADLDGNLAKRKDISGKVYLRFRNINLARWWPEDAGKKLQIKQGMLNGNLWLDLDDGKVKSLQSKLSLRHFIAQSKHRVKINNISGNIVWQNQDDGKWLLTGDDFYINNSPKLKILLQHQGPDDNNIYLSYLNIRSVTHFLQLVPNIPNKYKTAIYHLQPRGELANFYLQQKQQQWQISSQFTNITTKAWKHIPGISGISGVIIGNQDKGKLALTSQAMTLISDKLFTHPLKFNEFNTDVHWQKVADTWHITTTPILLDNQDFNLRANLTLNINKTTGPDINLNAHIARISVLNVVKYLPLRAMHPKLRDWLVDGLKGGEATQIQLVLRGPLKDFPFDKNQGEFQATSNLHNVIVNYKNGWPQVTQLNGNITFHDRKMLIVGNSGDIAHIKINHISAEIPGMGKHNVPDDLMIHGKLAGSLSNGFKFLTQGPMADEFASKLNGVDFQGPMHLALNLNIPLKHTKHHVKVWGTVTTQDAKLNLTHWHMQLLKINGAVDFTNHTLFGRDLKAYFMQQPTVINVTTLTKGASPITQFEMTGKADANAVNKKFGLPILAVIKGELPYHATLQLRDHKYGANSLIVTTDFKGVSIPVPEPFYKAADASVPFRLTMHFQQHEPMRVEINYGNRLNAALLYNKTNTGVKFYSGDVRLGGTYAVYQKQPGLLIDGTLKNFDEKIWQPFFLKAKKISEDVVSNDKNPQYPRRSLNVLRQIDLKIGLLKVMNQQFVRTHIQLTPGKDDWFINASGPAVAGQIRIPHDLAKGVFWAELQRLYLQVPKKSITVSNVKPQSIPALDLSINDFRLGQRVFGKTQIVSHPTKEGIQVNKLFCASGAFYVDASGSWTNINGKQKTHLTGVATSNNLKATLVYWNLPVFMLANNVNTQFNLNWDESPFKPKIDNIHGIIKLNIRDGRLVDIGEKANRDVSFGRLLNLLSIESLPKRLTFGFDDLSGKGYSFDSLKGDFTINNGIAKTMNTKLKGIVADVDLMGDFYLVKKKYDLELKITPHLTSSLPVIAAIAGGPVVGAVTWVASKVLSPAVDQITTRYYDVTGPWDKPVIKQIQMQSQQTVVAKRKQENHKKQKNKSRINT